MKRFLFFLVRILRIVLIVGGLMFIHDTYSQFRTAERSLAASREFNTTFAAYAEFRERGSSLTMLVPDANPPPGTQCFIMSFAAFIHFQREADLATELYQASVKALHMELAQPVSDLRAVELFYTMRNWSLSYSFYLRQWMSIFEPHLGERFCSDDLPTEPPGMEL